MYILIYPYVATSKLVSNFIQYTSVPARLSLYAFIVNGVDSKLIKANKTPQPTTSYSFTLLHSPYFLVRVDAWTDVHKRQTLIIIIIEGLSLFHKRQTLIEAKCQRFC